MRQRTHREAIKRFLDERGWSQLKLAQRAGLRPNTVTDLLKADVPYLPTLDKIARALDVPIWAFLVSEHEYPGMLEAYKHAQREYANFVRKLAPNRKRA